MPPSSIVPEKREILERLKAAKRRRDKGEARRRFSELQYFLHAEDDARLKEARLDWLDQHRLARLPRW
jgi:hypothetical protein